MALIALDIPSPEWPESSIEETISRAYLNERNEAAPLRQVRRSALPCKEWHAAAVLSLCLSAPAPSRQDSLLFSCKASATMAPSGAVAPNTNPALAGYYRPSLRRGSPFKWVHLNDCIHARVIPDKESGICCLYHSYTFMSGHDTPSLADHHRPSSRRGSPFKSIRLNLKYCIQELVIHDNRVKAKRKSDRAHRSLADGVRTGTARV
jgi:hypothetical protein